MHLSHSSVFAILPFLAAAIALAPPSARRGLAIPIAKRSSHSIVDPLKLLSMVQTSVRKFERGRDAYMKNTGSPHHSGGIKTRATGSVPLTDVSSDWWYGTLAIGTPPVKFTVIFDTGTSDLFVPEAGCPTCNGHQMYDPTASSTSQNLGEISTLTYGDGSSVTGEQYNDTVIVAGLKAMSQTLVAVAIGTLFYDRSIADGLMGMGFAERSAIGANPVFQTLVSNGAVDSPIFGFKLASSGSELFLGGTNSELHKGDFTWVPILVEGLWQAHFDVMTVTVEGFVVPVLGFTEAIFDTGTSVIIGDPDGIQRLYYQLTGKSEPDHMEGGFGIYNIPCSFSTPISFYFGEKAVKISPETFNLGPLSEGSDTCIGGAASSAQLPVSPDTSSEIWIFGDVFLRNTYSAWDVGNRRIGFADLI